MKPLNRRQILHSTLACAAAASLPAGARDSAAQDKAPSTLPAPAGSQVTQRRNRIHQSVSRWCYKNISLDDLCVAAAGMGLKAIDLLEPDEFAIPARHGLVCSMGYVDAGTIPKALNRVENHAAIEAGLRKNLPLAVKAGVPNVITFSGNRQGMSDEEGARNCVIGLQRMKPIIEDAGVTLCMELLNSKHDHHDYMCDHTAWGVKVLEEVGSPHIKLLYDIYHMQIMEGDVIRTIRDNIKYIGHFHTGGVPGRHELDDTQELQWKTIAKAIADLKFEGYFAHEFVPAKTPFASLKSAIELCTV
jgi:hydroxypyruvate isomerase